MYGSCVGLSGLMRKKEFFQADQNAILCDLIAVFGVSGCFELAGIKGKHPAMLRKLGDLVERGYSPIADAEAHPFSLLNNGGDDSTRQISLKNVGGVVGSIATAPGIPREAFESNGGRKFVLATTTQTMRLLLASQFQTPSE